MRSSRWLATLAIPTMVGAALVTNAAIATADYGDLAPLDSPDCGNSILRIP